MIRDKTGYWLLGIIVVLYLIIGALYAIKTPPWQAPDEPAHYNYVAQVVHSGCCPVIAPGDWDSALLEKLKKDGFPDNADLSSIQYEDHQPPLFYLLGALVYGATGGSLLALRLMSLAMGSGVVIAAYFTLARLFPGQKSLALAAAAFAAFLPQHVAINASANNDSLAGMVLGMLLVVSVTYLGNPMAASHGGGFEAYDESRRPHAAALGGLAGVAFLTKLTIYLPAVLAVAIAVIARWRIERRSLGWLAQQVAWSAGMAVAFGALWWARNILVYGWPDFAGLNRHNEVVVGQPRTAAEIARVGTGGYLGEYVTTVYHSFFGQFGWMGVPIPDVIYLLIGIFLIGVLAGLIVVMVFLRKRLNLCPPQYAGIGVLGGALAAGIAGLVQYNLTFVQFQGRYLYPGLIPLAGLIAVGLWGWALLAGRGRNEVWQRWLAWIPLAALAWMPLLDVWALVKYIPLLH